MEITNIPQYNKLDNKIDELDVRYGSNKPFYAKELILNDNMTYIPTPLNWYEVYKSSISIDWYYNNLTVGSKQRILIVRCGNLVSLCLPEFNANLFVSNVFLSTNQNIIPQRFLPSTNSTFTMIVKDNNEYRTGQIVININGSMYVYTSLDKIGFTQGPGGFPATYISWTV